MIVPTNRAIRQSRAQVFASGHAMSTPFYNRVESKKEVQGLFSNRDQLQGTAIIIASPFGTGKTFFIETIGQELGIAGRDTAMRVPGLPASTLKRARGDVLFLDEADTKSPWSRLDEGLARIGDELASSGRSALLLGDYALRNEQLLARLPQYTYVNSFEPLDEAFLRGVVQSRLAYYLGNHGKDRVEDIIEPELYEMLAPSGMTRVNSLRSIMAFLEQVADDLPYDDAPCRISREMARSRAESNFDPEFDERQEAFLNQFLDYLAIHHPSGTGLEDGFDSELMLSLGFAAGYKDWKDFEDGIIVPMGRAGILLSRGTPVADEEGEFVRFVEPFFPSLPVMLQAS